MIDTKRGKLFLCATPIGNLEDITLRVLRILKEVDLIAAEDTRRTRKLLTRYEIHTPLISFNQANEQVKLPILLAKLKQGKKIALVSDAGTPGIADPGHIIVKACLELGLEYELLPGASALIAAAVVSGLPTSDIRFLGFMPRRSGPRQKLLEKLADEPSTLVFYESPHRLINTLKDAEDKFPGRRMALMKEMTKKFAARYKGTAAEILTKIKDKPVKGEYVIVIEGYKDKKIISQENIDAELMELLSAGASKSEAAKAVAKKYRIPRRQVYDSALRVMKKRR